MDRLSEENMAAHQRIRWLIDFVESRCAAVAPWTAEQVLKWMCGIGLPPVGQSELPYVWIGKGIDGSSQSGELKRRFASRILECSEEIQQHLLPQRSEWLAKLEGHPGDAATNLWSLMTLLERPDLLGPVIRRFVELYDELRNANASDDPPWLSLEEHRPVRQRLLSAAIFNQDTDEFVPDWKLIACDRPCESRFQAGYTGDGVEGLVRSPGTSLERLEDIGEAIACYSRLEPSLERRRQLVDWLSRIRNCFEPFIANVDEQLILIADRYEFPRWVSASLPRLFVRRGFDDTVEQCYVWAPIYAAFRNSNLGTNYSEEQLCLGEVLRLHGAKVGLIDLIERISAATDVLRLKNPFTSDAVKREIVLQAMRKKNDLLEAARRLAFQIIENVIRDDEVAPAISRAILDCNGPEQSARLVSQAAQIIWRDSPDRLMQYVDGLSFATASIC